MSITSDVLDSQDRAVRIMRGYAGRVFYTHTDYGRGETDYVRVYVATDRDRITDVSFYVARATGRKITERGIAYGGGGYSKGLEAAMDAARVAGEAEPFDQRRWQKL